VENLTASVDIYNIEITDAIANAESLFVYAKCSTRRSEQSDALVNDPGG